MISQQAIRFHVDVSEILLCKWHRPWVSALLLQADIDDYTTI